MPAEEVGTEIAPEQATISADELDGQGQQQEAPEVEPTTETAPKESPEDRIAKLLEEKLKGFEGRFSKYDSELGQLRKLRSEFDRSKSTPQTNQPPRSVADLTPEQAQATKELLKHYVEELYGDKFKAWEGQYEQQQQVQQINSVYELAQKMAGPDFEKLNNVMGAKFSEYTAAARAGDAEAQQVVWEVMNTRSGVKALMQEAREMLAQSQQAKVEGVEAKRQDRARKATTGVNSTNPPSAPQYDADNLPKDRATRMKVIDELLAKVQG